MAKMIVDCERDVKGLHKWIGLGSHYDGLHIRWCKECGAIGKEDRGPSGKRETVVIHRVQED